VYEEAATTAPLWASSTRAFGDDVVGINKHTYNGSSWGAWGGGTTGRDGIISTGHGNQIVMTCGSCHDVHGSSNYRLLKDVVNGVVVGGYSDGTTCEPEPSAVRDLQRGRLSGGRLASW
jgi:predicted CXXCH cytochrome family protein